MPDAQVTAIMSEVFQKKDFMSKVKMLNRIPLKPVVLPLMSKWKEVVIPMSRPPINERQTSEGFQYIAKNKKNI
jgi:hypothetical protein